MYGRWSLNRTLVDLCPEQELGTVLLLLSCTEDELVPLPNADKVLEVLGVVVDNEIRLVEEPDLEGEIWEQEILANLLRDKALELGMQGLHPVFDASSLDDSLTGVPVLDPDAVKEELAWGVISP